MIMYRDNVTDNYTVFRRIRARSTVRPPAVQDRTESFDDLATPLNPDRRRKRFSHTETPVLTSRISDVMYF